MTGVRLPHSPEAERAVIGRIMSEGTKTAAQVVGTLLEPPHFYSPANRLLYEAIYEAYYADEPMDAITLGEYQAKKLVKLWDCPEEEAVRRVVEMADRQSLSGKLTDHAALVKRDSDYRLLIGLAASIEENVETEERDPQEIAGVISQRAMRIATNTLLTQELKSMRELGQEFIPEIKKIQELRARGIDLGAKFDLSFIDNHLHGLQPTELWVLAGDPGAGKTAVGTIAGLNFARRQRTKDADKRVGTLFLSLEMGEMPSKIRLAQTLTGIDSAYMREGTLSDREIEEITNKWAQDQDIPIYFDFHSTMKASQMRAIVSEAIRRHNVGLVLIDHFRHFRMDDRYDNQTREDEDKVLFIKQALCKDLNVAVICLAHTTKFSEANQNKRPTLSNLRGSGQIAATADFVSFMYRPFKYASEQERDSGTVRETDAEMLWHKSRFGDDDVAEFYFEPKRMVAE